MLNKEGIDVIKSRIIEKHHGDDKQLEIIFSSSSRLLVEAPAGYGKTHTMVSRIAYLMAVGRLPSPKKLLAYPPPIMQKMTRIFHLQVEMSTGHFLSEYASPQCGPGNKRRECALEDQH